MANCAKEMDHGEFQVISDISSGLKEERRWFLKLLEMVSERRISRIIVACEDKA